MYICDNNNHIYVISAMIGVSVACRRLILSQDEAMASNKFFAYLLAPFPQPFGPNILNQMLKR